MKLQLMKNERKIVKKNSLPENLSGEALTTMKKPREPRCDKCEKSFASWENVANHCRTQHDPVVEKYICPFWPNCKDSKHLNGLYQTLGNLRVHLFKHHGRKKGHEFKGLRIKKAYWRRKPYNIHDDDLGFDSEDEIPLSIFAVQNAPIRNANESESELIEVSPRSPSNISNASATSDLNELMALADNYIQSNENGENSGIATSEAGPVGHKQYGNSLEAVASISIEDSADEKLQNDGENNVKTIEMAANDHSAVDEIRNDGENMENDDNSSDLAEFLPNPTWNNNIWTRRFSNWASDVGTGRPLVSHDDIEMFSTVQRRTNRPNLFNQLRTVESRVRRGRNDYTVRVQNLDAYLGSMRGD